MSPAVLGALPLVGKLINKVIDKAVPDKDLAEKLKAEAAKQTLEMDHAELRAASDIILAEAKGESWLQRNWRPMLMLWFAGLVGAHWLGYTPANLSQETIDHLLTIVQVGVGGYVVGRSAEKVAKAWKDK